MTTRRRAPTAEQSARAAERREKFRDLARKIAALSDAERSELVVRAGAVLTCEGRALSLVNTLSLVMQRPGVSVVGGFWQWKRCGRRVRKGETGLSLWIPRVGKVEGSAADGPADLSYGGEPIGDAAGQRAAPSRRFIVGTVFDVSQTDPEPAPGTSPGEVHDGADVEAGELAAV
jgi:hypothetical protein